MIRPPMSQGRAFRELVRRWQETRTCEECEQKIRLLDDCTLYESRVRPEQPMLLHVQHCTAEVFLREAAENNESNRGLARAAGAR